MASSKERRRVGQELVLRVSSSGKGFRVIRYDGRGLADGVMAKRTLGYRYGDNAADKAVQYAENKAATLRENNECPVTVVEPGERMDEKLAEVHEQQGENE